MNRSIFTDEQTWFRESVAEFAERSLGRVAGRIREQRFIDRELWLEAGAHGFLGIGIPGRYGGSDTADFRFNVVLGEELAARIGLAYASSFGIQTDVVAPYLLELTSDEQKARWLPRFCTGELVTAIAMTEPEAGSDLAALRTKAVRADDGWVLNGSKTFITNGTCADLAIVAARTPTGDRGRGISLFAVERGMPGFTRGRKLDKVGQPEADTAELFFEDVHVPDSNVMGEVDAGFRHMMERLPQERLSGASVNLAHARGALEGTLAYVKGRHAFGRSIGSFQSNRFLLSELVTEMDVAQAFVDNCILAHVERSLSPVDAAKAKWWSSEVQNHVIDGCVQLHGGYGYMLEYDVARAWTDARVTKIWGGTNEIMKELIGRSLGLSEVTR
jgi:alkylation response protein AidB-like acyl-CoA dehydrogenase